MTGGRRDGTSGAALPGILAAALAAGLAGTAAARPGAPVGPVLTVLSTNDLHGALEGVVRPEMAGRGRILGGFDRVAGLLGVLKAADPAHTLVVDAGDCFQGEVAVNRAEGMPCAQLFNLAGYDARTVGNHEFDYVDCGPEEPGKAVKDPTCALRAVLARSSQPVVLANVRQGEGGPRVAWPNVQAGAVRDVGGVKVGFVGVVTRSTPRVSNRDGSAGLDFTDPVVEVREVAAALRRQGATVVVLLAHVTGQCGRGASLPGPGDRGCRVDGELRALGDGVKGLVDLIVAGHAHAWLAGEKGPVPVMETPGQGSFVARARIALDGAGRPLPGGVTVEPAAPVCREEDPASTVCGPQWPGWAGVAPSHPGVRAVTEEARASVADLCGQVVAEADEDVLHARGVESPLGNLTADLMREAAAAPGPDGRPQWADVAFTNAGSVRDSLRKGPVTACDVYRVWPFNDPLVEVRLTGAEVEALADFWVKQVQKVPAISGIRVTRYRDGRVAVRTSEGRLLDRAANYRVVTTAYLLKGGDRLDSFLGRLPPDRLSNPAPESTYRDSFLRVLRARGHVAAPALGRVEGM
jgi:2',3'-cyclic-nucleotide 2'-phosphodiesterase (5'-nucleotidase family)